MNPQKSPVELIGRIKDGALFITIGIVNPITICAKNSFCPQASTQSSNVSAEEAEGVIRKWNIAHKVMRALENCAAYNAEKNLDSDYTTIKSISGDGWTLEVK